MAAILSAILVIGRRTRPIFELELEVDKSNLYMKFGRNPIKNDSVRVTTDGQTGGQAENNRAPPTDVGGALIRVQTNMYIQTCPSPVKLEYFFETIQNRGGVSRQNCDFSTI